MNVGIITSRKNNEITPNVDTLNPPIISLLVPLGSDANSASTWGEISSKFEKLKIFSRYSYRSKLTILRKFQKD